ncbi:hypothetical protein QTL95_28205 [Rhizobium sp. S152]|uniref:hypothetical protein n=1 Tax=Rhizobium sp. S152 TaxID=3055038 RepID=UPI0025A9A000|nr:hypothetical protein [Rhizobium sp. S152]MDM9629771.1 hypothetical protein [Rhizobium sp. S152]
MGKKGGSNEAAQARADEAARQAKIRSGTTKVNSIFDGQFTPDYFDKQQQNFLDYASPQLEDQFGNASKELTFALTRAGLLDSSARAEKEADLQKTYDLNKQQIADQALSYKTQAQNNVEDARSNLISTLNATGDAEGAASSALTRASALSQPAAYSPLADLFTQFTAGLGTQAALEKANAYAGSGVGNSQIGRYGTGLFGTKGAVQIKP